MVSFILNNKEINTTHPPGMALLDFIRYEQQLTGTKIGCREGDCGACSILVGEIKQGRLMYSSATSCLMALGNAMGKHIVTIEGINNDALTPVQQAFAKEGATQCGFCTPGFIVSLTGYCLSDSPPGYEQAIDSMNGNICRCTGYKSIERAAGAVQVLMDERLGREGLAFAVEQQIIPAYFLDIKKRLEAIVSTGRTVKPQKSGTMLGGGTDLYVQRHDSIVHDDIHFLFDKEDLNGITENGGVCTLGSSVTVTDMATSPVFQKHFPDLQKYVKLVSSAPIRNMATIAGNIVNASPIGDFSIFFLALDAKLILEKDQQVRTLPLREFYLGYKQLNKHPEEIITGISFSLPEKSSFFNFEKVCKRTHLDIASVNTAMHLTMEGDYITNAGISAGGVAPVPAFLSKSSSFLKGKKADTETLYELLTLLPSDISPISDARGTAEYKRMLLTQLVKAHFIEMFPDAGFDQLTAH